MRRRGDGALAIAVAALVLPVLLGIAGAAEGPVFNVRIDAKILRKASGKLVTSLSAFELGDLTEARIENRKTGEQLTVGLSSVYGDSSYTAPLPPDLYDRIKDDEWLPFVVWSVPDTLDGLRDRLSAIYEHQNMLRRELGRAFLEESGAGTKVSSRLTLNKIEKFHRIATLLAGRYLKLARDKDQLGTDLYPLRIQIGFNPFGGYSPQSRLSPLQQVREIIYWEVHRILTQQFGIEEGMVDFVFNSPATVRHILPIAPSEASGSADFFPTVTVAGESIDCAIYLQRQGFAKQVKDLVRFKLFRDTFITDRPMVDQAINEGKVVGISGNKVAVTFITPFMRKNESVFIAPDGEGSNDIRVVLAEPSVDGGYTVSSELPEAQAARVRAGMPVRRK